MNTFSILASTGAQSSSWQLPGFLGTPMSVLLGWKQTPSAVDAAPPYEVAVVISRCLCRCARVTFLCSESEQIMASADEYSIQPLTERGFIARHLANWSGSPSHLVLISTDTPKVAVRLFDDGHFSWVMQGQYVFLSDLAESVPDLSRVASKKWQDKYEDAPVLAVNDFGLSGIMRPGVDGDVAGILFRSSTDKENFLAVLQEETEASHMHFKMCSETEFMQGLADDSNGRSLLQEHRGGN